MPKKKKRINTFGVDRINIFLGPTSIVNGDGVIKTYLIPSNNIAIVVE
jgi:hypothetical protein